MTSQDKIFTFFLICGKKEHTDTIPQGKLFIVIKSDNSFGKGKLKLQYSY